MNAVNLWERWLMRKVIDEKDVDHRVLNFLGAMHPKF